MVGINTQTKAQLRKFTGWASLALLVAHIYFSMKG